MSIIETERIIIREFNVADKTRMHEIYSDEDVMRYIGKGGVLNKEQTSNLIDTWINKFYRQYGYGIWGIEDKTSGELIGQCGFNMLPDDEGVEIAYLLSKENWHKGLATEAASETLKFGFDILGFKTICALSYPQNIPSIKVLNKLGMISAGYKEFYGITFLFFKKEKNSAG